VTAQPKVRRALVRDVGGRLEEVSARTRIVSVRFSDAEYLTVCKRAERLKLSVATYIHNRATKAGA
jgi:hypothetical protein